MSDAKRLIDLQASMESERARAENWYRDCARLIDPSQDSFRNMVQDFGRVTDIFDSTAPLALNRFQAWVEWALTPRSMKWHTLQAPKRAGPLGESHAVQQFYDDVTEVLFDYRYTGQSNFTTATGDSYRSLGVVGGMYLYIEEDPEKVIKYQQVPASECWFKHDQFGELIRFHRKYRLTLEEMVDEFGDALPKDLSDRAKQEPMEKHEILHCVEKNTDLVPERGDYRGMPEASFHVLTDKKQIIKTSGYRSWPYIAGTWSVADGETYPRSPGLMALASIRGVNEMKRGQLAYSNRSAMPPLLTSDNDLHVPDLYPDAINHGYLTPDGKPLLVPLQQSGQFGITVEMIQQERDTIDAFFLVDLFQILTDHPQMTATEVIERSQEKATLLAPALGRLQPTIGAIVDREISIHARAGTLPEAPEELVEIGGVYEVEYTSPLARRIKEGGQGAAIMRGVEGLKGFVDLGRPEVVDNLNADIAARQMLRSFGVDEENLEDERDVAETRAQRAERMRREEAAAGMPDAAKTVKDFADAASTAGLV